MSGHLCLLTETEAYTKENGLEIRLPAEPCTQNKNDAIPTEND